jgi:hypothetical protein
MENYMSEPSKLYLGSFHTEWRICPHCDALHDGATGVSSEPRDGPVPGSALICGDCGEWGIFDPAVQGSWRLPTPEEEVEVWAELTFQLAMSVVRTRLKLEGRGKNPGTALDGSDGPAGG